MKKLIALLSILTIGINTISFGASETTDKEKEVEAKESVTVDTNAKWEQLYKYSQYINDLKN